MSEHQNTGGIISRDEIAELSAIFDRFEYALDPTTAECRSAEIDFDDRTKLIFAEKIHHIYPSLTLHQFRCHLRTLCRKFLNRN